MEVEPSKFAAAAEAGLFDETDHLHECIGKKDHL
jgi:hypothetical protein